MDKVLYGVFEQSISVFGGFVNRLGVDSVKPFRVGLKKHTLTIWSNVLGPVSCF